MATLRKALARVCMLGAAMFALTLGTATAAGAWSAPEQIDHTGARQVPSYLISCPTSTLCVGSDYNPVIYHLPTGSAPGGLDSFALTIPYGSGDNGVALDSLVCPSASECLGVADYNSDEDDDLELLGTSAPGAGANAWTDENLAPGLVPTDLSCPTVSFCVGSGGPGVVTSQNPLGGAAWSVVTIGEAGLSAVDCPSTSFCAGFDGNGSVWTSTDPTSPSSAAWVQSTGAAPLKGAVGLESYSNFVDELPEIISCSGPRLCLAIDGAGGSVLRSTDPTQANWTPVTISASAIDSVECLPGTMMCLAGDDAGEIFTSADGGATWSASVRTSEGVQDITCTNTTCAAVGAGEGGDVGGTQPLLAQVPASGQLWQWSSLNALGHNALSWIACPSTKGCVGSDETQYYASANPGKGASSWASSRTLQTAGRKNDIGTQNGSCYSATGCLLATLDPANGLADVTGGTLFRFDPAGGAHAFAGTKVGGDDGVRYVTCAQGACVAGYPGNWYESAHPALNTGWKRVADPRFDVTCLSGNRSCVALPAGPFGDTGGPKLLVAAKRGGPWKAETIDPGQLITGLACTSARACVVVDGSGQLLASLHPTAGVSTWKVVDSDSNGFNGVACQSAQRCVAVDGNGSVVVGRP